MRAWFDNRVNQIESPEIRALWDGDDNTLVALALEEDRPRRGWAIANGITDQDTRSDVMIQLVGNADDPQLARSIADNIPRDDTRCSALADVALRDGVAPKLGWAIANGITDDRLRTEVLRNLVDRADNRRLAELIANDIHWDDQRNDALDDIRRRFDG